jgi:transposase
MGIGKFNFTLMGRISAMNKKYIVKLTDEERQQLEALVRRGKVAARKMQRAWILLKADTGPGGPGWSDEVIREAFAVGLVTIYRVRQAYVEEGLEAVLTRRPKSRHRRRKLDGEQEAHLIALTCSKPPPGRRRWTLRLLASKMVALGYTDHVAPETIRQTLKKTN